ncbi:MAG TPA: ABC transporter permease [Candidatus Limnocylindria bacterium]|nr:ABC transporter permease [Candidatus Limnocylindria bacterium]
MGTLMQDIRFGMRTLVKNPGFTAVAILTLALGIGANTAIFSLVDSFLLRPLPVKDPAQITTLAYQLKGGLLLNVFSIPDARDIREQTGKVFTSVIAYQISLDGLKVDGKADRIVTAYVGGNYFSMLGIKPALGRFILPSEEETPDANPVMVLGYSYWKTHFGGDPTIVNRKVSVDGHPVTIVGIAPEGFFGLFSLVDIQGYLPLGMASIAGNPPDFMVNRGFRIVFLMARLQPGVSIGQAQASLSVVAQRLAQEYPKDDQELSLQVFPELRSRPNPDPKNTILVISGLFMGLAALVLLLACVNVANILLVRATVREREMAIRAALGAGRARLIRQLLTESILLAGGGGLAGIVLGYWGSSALGQMNLATDLPVRLDFGFDWRVFGFAFGAALLTGIIVGLVPAIRASRGNLAHILHEGGRGLVGGRNRLRSALVVAQVAGSLMLLIIAGLFTRSLGQAQKTDLGFDPKNVVNFVMDPNEIGYNEAQGREFYKNLLQRVRALPGVEWASTANSFPMSYYNNGDTVDVEGYDSPKSQGTPVSFYNVISSDYFKTLRIGMIHGRVFTDADDQNGQYVGIVNEAMAKQYWPNQDPVGRHFKIGSDPAHTITVVGVAKDSRYQGVTGVINPYFYMPFAQHYAINSLEVLQVRTAAAPESIIPAVEHVIESLAPELPVFDVKTMGQAINTLNGLLVYQIGAMLAAALGILGLILALVGVYGVISFAASQKTHEIGIRMALGAQPMQVLTMIFRQGLVIVAVGLVVGLGAALAAAKVVGNFLAVSPTDPLTYITVSLALTAVALFACYIPARRAMRVDPMEALRYE